MFTHFLIKTNCMNHIKLITILLAWLSIQTAAQTSYPKGIYLTIDQVKSKTPERAVDLKVTERTNEQMVSLGGNRYKLEPIGKTVKKKEITQNILAYSDGKDFYLNCNRYHLSKYYTKVISEGEYLIFKSLNKASTADYVSIGKQFGVVGIAIEEGLKLKEEPKLESLYALSQTPYRLLVIDKNKLKALLKSKPELLAQFEREKESNENVYIKYLKLLNGESNINGNPITSDNDIKPTHTNFKCYWDLVSYILEQGKIHSEFPDQNDLNKYLDSIHIVCPNVIDSLRIVSYGVDSCDLRVYKEITQKSDKIVFKNHVDLRIIAAKKDSTFFKVMDFDQ